MMSKPINPMSKVLLSAGILLAVGCRQHVSFIAPAEQTTIDRSIVETPAGFRLTVVAQGLTAPSAITFDSDGTMFIAESGIDGREPRILAQRTDGSVFNVYPTGTRLPIRALRTGFQVYGPIGGMVATGGKLYVTHRDADDRGVVTAFNYDGTHETIVAGLPAQGDHSVTDIAVRPSDGRLFFGMGSATNSGVVGLDNWESGWAREHPGFCDQLFAETFLNGRRHDSRNPTAGLFGGGDEKAVTGAFQPFNVSYLSRIPAAADGKPNAAIYSVSPAGGDLQVEAHGIRLPAGIGFNEFGRTFATNQGMDLRGTRPIKDDPDAFLRILNGAWYGWPDYSADLVSVADARFQPPTQMIQKTGFTEIRPLIDMQTSNLKLVDADLTLQGVLPPQSGAAKFAFVPSTGPFKEYQKEGSVIIALSGDRAPFSTNNLKLVNPTGYKVVRITEDKQVSDFVVNVERGPASKSDTKSTGLERPIDIKFGPDGAMYILDMGQMRMKHGNPAIKPGSGKIFKLAPEEATTRPGEATSAGER